MKTSEYYDAYMSCFGATSIAMNKRIWNTSYLKVTQKLLIILSVQDATLLLYASASPIGVSGAFQIECVI